MDLSQLSYSLLEEAITKGTITVENRVINLTGTQIISVLKYILDKNIETKREEEINIPTEMFSSPYKIEEEYEIDPISITNRILDKYGNLKEGKE